MITVQRGDELGEGCRRRIAEVFASGFADDFRFFAKDPAVLARALEHMLVLDRFYVASLDGEPAALATVTTGTQQMMVPQGRELRRHLGPVRGRIFHRLVSSWFTAPTAGLTDDVAEIGFVTTTPRYQGRGLATALLRHLIELPGYRAFVLEDIKDTNEAAFRVYGKLGFTAYKRRPARFSRFVGFTEYICMWRDAPQLS